MNAAPAMASQFSVPIDKRIDVIDVLRGVAIFGVLASDMIGLSSPDVHFGQSHLWTDPASRVTAFLLDALVSEKFITIFSVLFGVGFAIQMERVARQGATSLAFYWRRLAILFIIGLIHGLFFWAGDILTIYAVFGLLLALFRNCTQKTVLSWAIGLHALLFTFALAAWLLGGKPSVPSGETARLIMLYGQGSWTSIQNARVSEFLNRHVGSLPLMLLYVFPRLLFGLWLWRAGFLQNLSAHGQLLRRLCLWTIAIGAAGEGVTALLAQGDMGPLRSICTPLLACGYACAAVLFVPQWLRRALAATGRMSLSNYLFQRILCTTLFYSYGFGLYGKVGPLAGVGLTSLIYLVELGVSAWWIRRFHFGPVEWLWRSGSYWKLQRMRVHTAEAIVSSRCS
jgi:uncharacterized protein